MSLFPLIRKIGDGLPARVVVVVGVAGWSIPSAVAHQFSPEGSHLQRYASIFNGVEINSSFHRTHRRSTYERWAASVPTEFRFAVKLPKAISHMQRLQESADALEQFAGGIAGLGERRGPLLVQLPPSLVFKSAVAQRFFADARRILGDGTIVCEPRHPSWFADEAEALLIEERVTRVIADPSVTLAGQGPGGWRGLAYFRLHGSPVIYRSGYQPSAILQQAHSVRSLAAAGVPVWTVFDNTASGAAPANALALRMLTG